MINPKKYLLRTAVLKTFLVLSVICTSCNHHCVSELPPEPGDPDAYDMSVWKEIEPGIHSGFGSIDIAYSKSIPPLGNIAESIKLQGWRGERVNCLLLVWTADNKEEVNIKASGFRNDNYKIDKKRTSVSVVEIRAFR